MKRKVGKKDVQRRTNVNRGEGVRKRREWKIIAGKRGRGKPGERGDGRGKKDGWVWRDGELKSGDGKFKRGERDVGRVLKEI